MEFSSWGIVNRHELLIGIMIFDHTLDGSTTQTLLAFSVFF